MAIGKPRGKKGMRPVFVYDPAQGRKVYVGSRQNLRGTGGAQELEREKQNEFACLAGKNVLPDTLTCRTYSDEWLELHHGDGTRRPAKRTEDHNRSTLQPFLKAFGDRDLDGGISRREALAWARKYSTHAKVVSAMFNDAFDDELTKANPFAGRRNPQGRERKHIDPLTEAEVDRLGALALKHWGDGGYGLVARAWVLFGAWVGCRPGETTSVTLADLDFRKGEARIRRVKKRGGKHPVDTVVFPKAAQDAITAMPSVPPVGPVFRTAKGRPFQYSALSNYWDPIRVAFRESVTEERWVELLDGSEDGKNLDFYALRHFCASMIVARGGNEYDVSAQLGNSPKVARATYIHSYREERNERNRRFLDGGTVVDLGARRKGA